MIQHGIEHRYEITREELIAVLNTAGYAIPGDREILPFAQSRSDPMTTKVHHIILVHYEETNLHAERKA